MTDADAEEIYLVDCHGLREIAKSKSNSLKSMLSNGTIVVPSCVWQEFSELFEEEAAVLAPLVHNKLTMKRAYHIGAASIAERSNPGFSSSPYDSNIDLYCAAICAAEGYTLLTTVSRFSKYKKMRCCEVMDVAALGLI
jgi:hypothetical protein